MAHQITARNVRSISRLAGTVAALAISVAVVTGSATTTHAAAGKDGLAASTTSGLAGLTMAGLGCSPSAEGYEIYLPFTSSGQFSLFFVSVDGGAWGTTNWFYSEHFQTYEFTSAGWRSAGLYFDGNIGGGHDVRAWEYRFYPNGTSQWINLGSCRTSHNQGWLTYTYN